jgi:exodeoxyribonuclease-5
MINCTLSNKQLRILRTKIAKDLLTYVDNNEDFDLKDYLSKIYNQVNDATKNQNLALDYARVSLPFIKQLLGVDSTLENLPEQGLNIAELYKTTRLAGDDKNGFQVVVDYLGVTVNPAKNLGEVKDDLKKEEDQEKAAKKNVDDRAVPTIYKETRKPYDPVSTSMQEVLSGKPESVRDPRMKIYSDITKMILDKIPLGGEKDFEGIEYPGVNGGIFVKMMRYNKIAVNDTFPYVKEVIESGVDKDYIIEDYNFAFVYVLTDKDGTELRFNDKGEVSKSGTLVYYNTRFLPKRGADKLFDVNNVTNTQKPIEVAKNLGISIEDATEFLRSGFEELAKAYDYIRSKEGNTIMYSITGGSNGAIVDTNRKMVPFEARIFKNEPVSFAFYAKDKLKPGDFSGVYATGARSNYPVLIAPRSISDSLATDLAEMLTKSVNKSDGQPLSNKEKVDILSTYILNSVKDIQYGIDKSNGAIYIKLEGQPLKLSSPEAADTLKNVFLKQPSGFDRKNIIALPLANSNKNVTVFSKKPNGTFSTESVPYMTYMEQNMDMYVELDEDGLLKRYNPYFNLMINLDSMGKVLLDEGNVDEEKEETPEEAIARLRAEEQIELRKEIPNIESYKVDGKVDKSLMSPEEAAKYDEIYKKYDILISPLMGKKPSQGPTENKPEEFVNHSGGAYGGDTLWDLIGREFGVVQHKHYREKANTTLSKQLKAAGVQATVLTEEQMEAARDEVERLLGKKYPNTTEGNLQVRNYYQVANSDSVFAVATLNKKGDGVTGGTNTAVQLGIKLNKPVYVWDIASENWTKWDGTKFTNTEVPILTKNFAGVGSRDIESYPMPLEKDASGKVTKWGTTTDTGKYKGKEKEEAASRAIREVYEKTFGKPGQATESIYPQLGDKTQSPNIVISNIKTKDDKYDRAANIKEAQDNGRVYSMETDSDLSFSNPWAHFKRGDTIKTASTKEAVQNYIDWLTTDKFKDIKPERREWILNQLKSGSLKGKAIQYYTELNEPSHATALDYLINKYDWSKGATKQPAANLPGSDTTINIYSTDKNGFQDLSNFGIRPFKINIKRQSIGDMSFQSVEQAYQWMKGLYTNNYEIDPSVANAEEIIAAANAKDKEIQDKILATTDGAALRRLGKSFKNFDSSDWDAASSAIMKALLRESFKANPEALAKLLSTGEATLTHTQDKSNWKTEFPRLLMQVRKELAGSVVTPVSPVEQKAAEVIQKIEPQQIFRRGRSSADSSALDDLMNDDDFINKNGKNKLGIQGNLKATREQIALAKTWYENSPLKQHIPFKVMFNAINTATKNGIARWDVNGITLFKGSDYSDLYHEAWHGFTQTFLTKEERDKLYKETRLNKGSFVAFDGSTVTFKEATEEQLEEYLAEDFREYMLGKGKKVLDKTPVKKNIFQKIFEFLKALFGKTNADDVITNGNNNSYTNELYEKLRVGDLNQFTFNQANRVFTTLNKVVTTTTPKDNTTPSKLGYEDSALIGSTVDALFVEAIAKLNGGKTHVFTTAAIRTVKGRTTVYKYVLQELTKQLENVYLDKLDMEAKGLDTQDIDYELDTLSYAVKHFGNPNELSNPTGVIKYHMETSKFMEFDDRQLTEMNKIDDSKLTIKNEFESKSGNEMSGKEKASPILLYTIRGLYAYDTDGSVKTNKLGFPKLMDPNAAWNRIYNITDGSRNIQDVYNRLSEAAVDYPAIGQFLEKVGPPTNMETSSQQLWTDITNVLTMKRIPLMAVRATFSSELVEAVDPETGEVLMEGNKPIKETVTTFKVTPTRAGGEYSKVGAKWDNHFAVAAPNQYITVGADNVNTLNIQAVAENFNRTLSINNLDTVFEFMEAVGMPLENNSTVRKALANKNNPTFKAIYDLHTTILYGIYPYNNMYAGANPIVIKKPSDLVKEYKVDIDDFKVANKLSGISIKYNTIQNFHLTWSDDFSDTTVSNAEGENQYEKSLRGTLMNQIDSINTADTITELTQEGVSNAEDLSMNHLAKSRNPFMKTSKFMKRLFDKNGNKIVYESTWGDRVRSQIELLNMSGTSVEVTTVKGLVNESGIASSNADETTKTLQDFYMMMLYGVSEATRHADKSTTYLFRLLATDPKDEKGKVLKHLIDLASFTQRSNPEASSKGKIEFTKDLFQHLCAEYERIQKLKDGDPAGMATVGNETYAERGSEFVIFDKILDTDTKTKIKKARNASLSEPVLTAEDLYKYLNDPKRVELKNSIEQQIGNYLTSQVKEFEESLTDMGFYNNPQLYSQVLNKMGVRNPEGLTEERRSQLLKDMAEAYVANAWLQNLEVTLLFYGDPALYPGEADFFKRNAGLGATGTIPRTDIYMQEYVNAKLAANSEAARQGFKPKKFGKTMTSAVMQDAKTQSVYYDEYLKEAIEFETDRLTKLKASEEQIKKTVAAITKRFGEYKKMTEGDGQGWINFDAYRALLMSLNKWTPTQESIYNKIVNREEVTEDVLQFFPVKKMQYWGPLSTEGLPIMGFHKFSLMPLIPNIIKGKNLDKLQSKMLEQGIDYALLKSGSKISTLTKEGVPDKFYNEPTSNRNKSLAIEDEGFTFTPNEIFMDYFKDQLEVHDHFNNKVTFSTQLRKLIEDGLMENGVPTDWKPFDFTDPWERIQAWEAASDSEKMSSKNYKKLIRYEANLEALVQLKKDKLVKEIGSDMKSLLEFVKKELTRQELSDHEINFIDYDGITKEPKQSLDLSLSADKIEKLLVSVVQKRLINQKITGETLVQVSGVGFEDANKDMRNATEEELKKYGTNGLTFYRKKADGSTAAMKIKIALQGGFKKLLYHPDITSLASKNNITPLQALNTLLKDENWLDKPINPNQEIYAKAFAKLDNTKGDTKLFILKSELTPELMSQLTPSTKDGERVKGGEYHGIKILGDYYTHDTVKSRDGANLDIIVVDKVEDAENQYQEYLKGGAKNFTGVSEVEPVDKNRSFITMVAARIPVQGLNSMEFMEVYEFLPEEAGNIVILPAEIVAKSGGDFDIDKMFTMMPNISAKYKKISDKSLKTISDEFGRTVTRQEIEELEEKYADVDNEEPFTDEEIMILDLVDTLSEDEISVKLDKSRKSVKGIENALIKDSVDILSMPENRIKLITPNGIDILKGIADDMAYIDRGEEPGTSKSPTEIFELGRNLYKHQSNSIGKAVLGIIAVANTFNTLFARTGLIMSEDRIITYKKDGTPVYAGQNLYLPHNSINGNISLSSAYSTDLSNRVADIINQMINGAVDVAKDAWIFDIQGNKEVIPSLLFMIQAGVPIDQAVYFVSQPIIKDFLSKQRLLKSKFAVPIGQEDVGLFHRIEARNQILFNIENGFTQKPEEYLSKQVFGDTNVFDKALVWNLLESYAPSLETYSKDDLKKNLKKKEGEGYNNLDRAVFTQFIMIQEMAGQVTQLTQALKFDNDKTSTLLDARMKLEKMDNLTNGISSESIRKISEESPISAFKIQDFIIDQYHHLFPLRDSEEVNNFIQNIFRRQGDGKNQSFAVKKATGMDDETLQRTLRNDLISFLFQRSYYKFDSNTSSYQGKDVEIEIEELKNLKAAARVKEGKLYIDKKQINSLFSTKQYSKQSAWQFAAPVDSIIFDMYDPVTGKQLFTKFVFEREVLRSYPENSKENISKTKDYAKYIEQYKAQPDEKYTAEHKAYESVLRDKALGNLNLHGYLFYGDKAYGRQIMQLKESNPSLFEKYSVLANMEAVTKPYTTTTLTNLKFANTLYTSDDLNIYHNNLQDLANPSVIKSEDPVENARISELFQKFGLFSLLQSGTDTRSTFSMIRAVPTEMSMALFEKPYKQFTEELKYDEIESLLRDYQNTFVTSQYARSNYLSKKIKNWATNPLLKGAVDANGNIPDNVIYNLDPEALQKAMEAAAEAEKAAQEQEARNVMIKGIPVNLTQLGISFTPNDQQVEALNNIAEFISKGYDMTTDDVTDNMYTLMGYAGTGKTSITKILLEYLRKRNISYSVTATTHKAKGVLSKAIGMRTKTIHKSLALAPKIDPTRVSLKDLELNIVANGESPTDVLIIDESSFIGPDLFKFIKRRAEKSQQQVIFIGDPAQLKPVAKEKKNRVVLNKENSPVFREVTNKSELTQVERQAGDNPLGPILDSIRNNMKESLPTFGYKSKVIGNEGIVFTKSPTNFAKDVVKAFQSEEFRNNRNFVRAITYENSRVEKLNAAIRKGLGYTEPYVVGEIMMGYSNYKKQMGTDDYAINNSVDYIITNIEYVPSRNVGEKALKESGLNLQPMMMSGYNITLQDISDSKIEPVEIFMLDNNNSEEQFRELGRQSEALAALGAKSTKLFKHWYRFMESFALNKNIVADEIDPQTGEPRVVVLKTLDYGYAHTIHKSQGSTYTNIFVDLDNINVSQDIEERNQMKYVALSRATNIAYALTENAEGDAPQIDFNGDFVNKTIVPSETNKIYKTEADIQTSKLMTILEDRTSGVRTFRYTLDDKSGTAGKGVLTEETARMLREDYPNALMVFNNFTDLKGNTAGTNSVWRALGSNGIGISTKVGPSPTKLNSDKVNMSEALTDETLDDNKKLIDEAIKAIKEKLAEPGPEKYLVFDDFGYGQYMIGYVENAPTISRPTLKAVAPQTFLHLSEQLYRNFGYINPHYLLLPQGRAVVQEGQPITDDEIIEQNKKC